VGSLSYSQLTYSIGLNEFCDSPHLHSGPLVGIYGATAPSRNGLSNANRQPPAEMAEELFWQTTKHTPRPPARLRGGRYRAEHHVGTFSLAYEVRPRQHHRQNAQYDNAKRIWMMGPGFPTEALLKQIRQSDRQSLT
jgi:hypothetical protein